MPPLLSTSQHVKTTPCTHRCALPLFSTRATSAAAVAMLSRIVLFIHSSADVLPRALNAAWADMLTARSVLPATKLTLQGLQYNTLDALHGSRHRPHSCSPRLQRSSGGVGQRKPSQVHRHAHLHRRCAELPALQQAA